jgi:hypothetical protein
MCCCAQISEGAEALKKIGSYYSGPELKHAAGQMLLTSKGTGKQLDKVSFEYWVKGAEAFTKMNYIEILNSKDVYVMVNNKRNTIYARPQSQVYTKSSVGLFDPEQLNMLLNTKGAKVTVLKAGGSNKLTLSGLQNTGFSSVTITYSASDFKILNVKADIAPSGDQEGRMLEVIYSFTDKTASSGSSDVFSSAKYLTATGGKTFYAKAYQNYQKL